MLELSTCPLRSPELELVPIQLELDVREIIHRLRSNHIVDVHPVRIGRRRC